ncbi:EF-hand domain-containing protein [Aspergillus lucknowensis]|uniref:EF-hand domain-containing protein n=1 Tax=Aspergillus lucknowensis TaxID=176173 RepID=A0ABR4LVI7_9EURO
MSLYFFLPRRIPTERPGYITPEELVEYGQRAGVGITAEDAASLIAELDLDKDGKVSFSEFIKALGERA